MQRKILSLVLLVPLLVLIVLPVSAQAGTINVFTGSETPEFCGVNTGEGPVQGNYGLRFKTTESGNVMGIRFYRSGTDTSHTVTLWSNTGTQLGTGASAASGSGWETVSLSSPVHIDANTDYIVSYSKTTDQVYCFSSFVFTGSAITNGSLSADTGKVAVTSSGFPSSDSMNKYWVDVAFRPDSYVPDTPTPTRTSTPASTPTPTGFRVGVDGIMGQAGDFVNTVFPLFAIVIGLTLGIWILGFIINTIRENINLP